MIFHKLYIKIIGKKKKSEDLNQPRNKISIIKKFIKSKKSIYRFLIKILILKIILKKIISKKKLKHDAEF